jgi:TPR repeat protein
MERRGNFLARWLIGAMFCASTAAAAQGDLKQGALAYSKGDLPGAVNHLRPLAEGGHALAQYLLGVALANAKPPLLNVAEGEGWLMKSAAQGNIAAMRDLGQLSMFGKSPPNRAEAEKWLLAAANRGDEQAQHLLGVFYLDAKGSERRPSEAYKWLLLASQRGHLLSGVMLTSSPGQFEARDRLDGERLAAEWAPVR